MSAAAVIAPATALVIDDEAMVRQLVRRMLEPEFCKVLEAGDGEAGLRMIGQNGERIDVVLTDLLMPGIDGYDVVDVLAAYRPDLPVACMSGFASHTSIGRTLVAPFIPKPFNAETLRGLLQPLIVRAREVREQAQAERVLAADQKRLAEELRRRSDAARAEAIDLVEAALVLRQQRAGARPPH